MIQSLAMFPLELVVFPGEKLALHIFEERYQQLISDCETQDIHFGIPSYIDKKMRYGTQVRLKEIIKRYPSGASDVICEGLQSFRLESFKPIYNDKLYAGGEVEFLENIADASGEQKIKFYGLVSTLYEALDVELPEFDPQLISSFTLAHKIGLSIEQELKLIKLQTESERFDYLISHLTTTIPVVQQINRTRELIQLNGHFKNFDPLDFSDYHLQDL